MFDNDDAARRALHTLTDEPAPPIATSFEQVLRRGRRRVFVQRASTVAGVVAVVAAIGVGAVLLRPGDPSGGVQVGDTSTSSPSPTGGPSNPAFEGLDGWQPVTMPPDADGEGSSCMSYTQGAPRPDVALPSQEMVMGAFADAVKSVVGQAPTTTLPPNWQQNSEKFEQARGAVAVEVGMDNGNGQLQLEVSPYSDQAGVAADRANTVYGNCEPPYRHTLADGTVLQIYPTEDFHPEAPTQAIRIYRPDGFLYVITSAGYGDADFVDVPNSSARALEGGRGKLPTTATQLVAIAEGLMTNLYG
jgi:hypothetical protein